MNFKLESINDIQSIIEGLNQLGYVIDEELATIVFLLLKVKKPILVEGNPGIGKTELVYFIQNLRKKKLQKVPGISETLDWALSLMVLGYQTLDIEAVERTFGCVLKSADDIRMMKAEGVQALIL